MDIKRTLNDLFVDLFRDISNLEEQQLKKGDFSNLTMNDIHVIHAIGLEDSVSMSKLAKSLGVTVGTLTISINGLLKKGYVNRVRFEEDRRVVLISLTSTGKSAYKNHAEFHDQMMEHILKQLSENEQEILEKSLVNLKDYFEELKDKI